MEIRADLKALVGKITEDGKEISFREYLRGRMTGSGELFDPLHERIIDEVLENHVYWADAEEYLCPLVDEILLYALEEDPVTFIGLLRAIEEAYSKLKSKYQADHEYFLDRDKEDFFRKFDGLIHELASGKVIKDFDASTLGQYRVVIGLPDEK